MSKESIDIIVNTVESLEKDFNEGKSAGVINATVISTLMVIKLARENPNNDMYEKNLDDLELRLSKIST